MQIKRLQASFDNLQKRHGDRELRAVYGAGDAKSPRVCFVFMNPTARNISSKSSWRGLRAPWLGTKNTWKLLNTVGILSDETNRKIQALKPGDWDEKFANEVYGEIKSKKCFITNLAKCTKADASHLSNSVFKDYLELMNEELYILNPKIIITFGNQVSSVLLGKSINVSKCRKQRFPLRVKNRTLSVFPVYYPVGQGMRNINKSLADIQYILNQS